MTFSLFARLWDSIIVLLSNYSSDPIVLDLVSKSFISSSVYSDLPDLNDYTNCHSLLDLFLSSFLSFDWSSNQVPSSLSSLVGTVLSTIGCLIELFDESIAKSHLYSITDFIGFSLLPSSYSADVSTECILAAGTSFPQSLPLRFLELFQGKRIHFKLLDLVSNYMMMSEDGLCEILKSIIVFFKSNPLMVMFDYTKHNSENDSHLMLLFAASHFAGSTRVQSQLWLLLNHIITKSMSGSQETAILRDLNMQTILPTLVTVAKEMCESPNSMQSLCLFLCTYMNKSPMPFVHGVCFSDDQQLLRYMIKGLSKSLESSCDSSSHKEIKCLCSTLHLFHSLCAKDTHCARILQSYNFINEMAKAVQSCPLCCGHTYCMTIGSVALQNTIPPKDLQWYHAMVPLKSILTSSLPLDERADVYNALHVIFKSSNLSYFIDRDFADGFVTAFIRDVKELPVVEIRYLIYATRLVIEPIKSKDFIQSLFDSNFHEAAIEGCLSRDIRSSSHESLLTSISFINYIMRLYQDYLGNIDVFVKCNLLKRVVDIILVKEDAKRLKNYGDQYGSIVLNLTATKRSSTIIYDQGLLELLYSLVGDGFDSGIVKNTVHAVGNIALAGHHVKQDILSVSFHSKLIQLLEKKMKTGDVYLLSACCRVLHILCSGDWAKREYALEGLVTTLLTLCKTRNDSPEIVWRPLGLLSSISFMSLCNRQYLVSDSVMDDIIDLFKKATDSKVISYFTLIVLAFSDLDRQFTFLSSRGVVSMIQTHMNNKAGNVDFKRWGSTVLERGYLFTVTERREEEEEIISLLESSITWPPSYSELSHCNDGLSILLDDESQLSPFFPEGSQTVNKGDVASLGIQDPVFRVSRYYGSTHGLCSNCDKEGPSEELVFRPHNLTPLQYQSLVTRGWYRRGGVKMFRYRYNHNIDCSDWETRVLLADFNSRQRKSYRKVLKRMPEDRLTVETVPTQFIQEAYELYNSYHIAKHDKPKKSRYSYCEHVVNSPMRNQYSKGGPIEYGTYHQLYRLDGKLVAVGVIDIIPNGVISIYMWYDMSKDVSKYSFGVYSALKEIEYAQKLREKDPNIRYYYMQGWNGNNHKLAYKSNYEPEEFYSPCTASDWVFGLSGVEECQKKFKEEKTKEEDKDGSSSTFKVNDVVAGAALPLDRVWYERVNSGNGPLVDELLLCINDSLCIKFKDLLDRYDLCIEQVNTMRSKLEELMLALGPELCSSLIVDIKLCPSPSPPLSIPVQATD